MFGSPVFIKQHGIIVDDNMIVGPITLNASVKRNFSLITDDMMVASATMRVQSRIQVDVYATITLAINKTLTKHTSAAAINASVREELIAEYLENEAMREAELAAATTKSRRRRRNEDEDETDEEDVEQKAIDYAERSTSFQSFDIYLSSTDIEDGDAVDVRATEPYKHAANLNDEAAGKLERTLGKLTALVRKRGDALNSIRGGAVQSSDSLGDLVPSNLGGPDIHAIDQAGLRKYEESLREQVEEADEMIRKIYDSMQKNVLDRFNESNTRRFRMKEDFKIRDVSITVESAMEELFKEIVPVRAINAK